MPFSTLHPANPTAHWHCQCRTPRRVFSRAAADGTSSSAPAAAPAPAAAAAAPAPAPVAEDQRFHEAYAQAFTMSQLYVKNRPEAVPLQGKETQLGSVTHALQLSKQCCSPSAWLVLLQSGRFAERSATWQTYWRCAVALICITECVSRTNLQQSALPTYCFCSMHRLLGGAARMQRRCNRTCSSWRP